MFLEALKTPPYPFPIDPGLTVNVDDQDGDGNSDLGDVIEAPREPIPSMPTQEAWTMLLTRISEFEETKIKFDSDSKLMRRSLREANEALKEAASDREALEKRHADEMTESADTVQRQVRTWAKQVKAWSDKAEALARRVAELEKTHRASPTGPSVTFCSFEGVDPHDKPWKRVVQDTEEMAKSARFHLTDPNGDVARLKTQFKNFKEKVESGGGITCNGITFTSQTELASWFKSRGLTMGCFMDAHAMLHAIRASFIHTEDASKQMETRKKTDVPTSLDGAVLTSFATILPTIFVGGKKVVEGGVYDALRGLPQDVRDLEAT